MKSEPVYRRELIEVGVGFFCFANGMMFALPEYAGLSDKNFLFLFRFLSFFCATMSLLWPFRRAFQETIQQFLKGQTDLDQPIMMGLLGAYSYSVYSLFSPLAHSAVYFDSVSCIVALLLAGRYTKNRILEKALSQIRLSHIGIQRLVFSSSQKTQIPIKDLKKDSLYQVILGDLVPVESMVVKGLGVYDLSALNGEPLSLPFSSQDRLPSGSVILEGACELKALEDGTKGFVHMLEKRAQDFLIEKSQWASYSKVFSRYYLGMLIFGSALCFFLFWHVLPQDEIFRRVASLLLIACPCSLGLSLPLIYARAAELGSQKGVIYRNTESIERAGQIKQIFFDKTGTVTSGVTCIENISFLDSSFEIAFYKAVLALPYSSHHHIIKAIYTHAKKKHILNQKINVEYFEEKLGESFSWIFDTQKWTIKNHDIFCQDRLVAHFSLKEEIQHETFKEIQSLQAKGYQTAVLSGDTEEQSRKSLKDIFSQDQIFGRLSPEMKKDKLSSYGAMVGNGVNDLLAMGKSYLSIAVKESVDCAREIADVYLTQPFLINLGYVFSISKKAKTVFFATLGISFLYNTLTLIFAALGFITPLAAAIIMPVSSLVMIALSYGWRT